MNNLDIGGKKILLLYARFFEYDKIVRNKLIQRGAIVDLYDARANISTIGKALLKKTDKFYKKKQLRFHKKICHLNRNKNYDFIFTNENLSTEVLSIYKEAFPNSVFILYLDDSVANFRKINETFQFYDKVLTFDSEDSKEYGIEFRPLFFNDLCSMAKNSAEKKHDICFIGTAHSDRMAIITKIIKKYPDRKIDLYLFLQSRFVYFYMFFTKKEFRKYKFKFFKYKKINMNKVVEMISDSKAVLDIQHPNQTGLTMRTIESIGLKKKIITTNRKIEQYDFFNPNNIFVIDRDNPSFDEKFFDTDYVDIGEQLYHKYSIDGWIDDVFRW